MKKIHLTFLLIIICTSGFARLNNSFGFRFGGGAVFGGEFSFEAPLSRENRLELDLGIYSDDFGNGISLATTYQWVWHLEGGFNWYAGPSIALGSWKEDQDYKGDISPGFFLGIGGQVGAEYNFSEIPVQISADIRPMYRFGQVYTHYNLGFGLGIRYTF